jgi:hypothetical protein
MRDPQHVHRREAYGVRGSSTSRRDSLCEGAMSRWEGTGMASDRVFTTNTATPGPANGSVCNIPARAEIQTSGGGLLTRTTLHARVSTDKQERGETVASQVDLLTQTAAVRGYNVAPGSVFIDEGISGTRLDRPALERLRDLVAEGAFEVVLVTAPDCLACRYAYQVVLIVETAPTSIVFRAL